MHASALSHRLVRRSVLLATCCVAGCARHEATAFGTAQFVVLAAEPTDGEVYLNDPVRITFSQAVDPGSLSPATVDVREVDANGAPAGEPVAGTFQLLDGGRVLRFEPRLPDDGAFANGGLHAGRRYRVQLAALAPGAVPVVRATSGGGLAVPFVFEFGTRTGTLASELFRDPKPGGPARTGLDVTTAASLDAVPLGLFGAPPLAVRLSFDQALNPQPANVPVGLDTDPATRGERGRIFLEYADADDPPGEFTWIPADVRLERNDASGAVVGLRPLGVLPNHATVRVIVEATLEDIAGESNAAAPGYERVFGQFRTAAAWGQQWDAVVERFDARSHVDADAPFPEPVAEVGPGGLRAAFAFDGGDPTFDYTAPPGETVLNTNATTLVPVAGAPRYVSGGVFRVHNLTIPAGSIVVGQGTNPMVFLCSGKVTIEGTLTVRGGDGRRAELLGGQYRGPGDLVSDPMALYLLPLPAGGIARCGGGSGGLGSPSMTERDARGGAGNGPGEVPGAGGRGGLLACVAGCYTGVAYNGSGGGSGGGGGALATQGDPHFLSATPANMQPNTAPTANTVFQQKLGFGGTGCSGGSGTRTAFLIGGEPAAVAFTDARPDNDFWGAAFDAHRQLRIRGELTLPRGGSGGGGGGDTSHSFDCSSLGNLPATDERGGGGGAGGGVIVIEALDEIWITDSGRVVADGGNGGGGSQRGACGEAGGGGGGAGGMVVLMTAKAIRIEAHGGAQANRFAYSAAPGAPFLGNDYTFAVSADGGVCTTGGFGTVFVSSKYPASGQTPIAGTSYDADPLGGFGGMGIVQLMTPPGTNADGTNTVLDDNIHFYLPGQLGLDPLPAPIAAAGKRQLLGWRGLPDGSGQSFDDAGQVVDIGDDEGDIRPAPILLPAPFGSRSRARSRWIDTGSSARRALAAPDEFARGIVTGNGAVAGPVFEFAGTDAQGFAAWMPVANSVLPVVPVVVPATPIADLVAHAWYLGAPAYRLRLASPVLPASGRYAQYDAELLSASNTTLASFRILAHDDRELVVDPDGQLLPGSAVRVRVVARFFDATTNGVRALPALTPASTPQPRANVRIGFAFHTDPFGVDPLAGRYPATSEQDFAYDLGDPELQQWIAVHRPRFVQWDVTFDLAFDAGSGAPPLTANPPRPELHSLRLPFRF
ncbi:MAG TPA: Ig-like domain-containing protein [Planctomycetota bacterium]|nr:Ig-like domain-containing protein [Planctomycetota bacterium]